MNYKIRQKTEVNRTTKIKQHKEFLQTDTITNDNAIDSLKEEVAKVILKWLKAKTLRNSGKTNNQSVDVSVVNGSQSSDPPENSTMVNIFTIIVNCHSNNDSE